MNGKIPLTPWRRIFSALLKTCSSLMSFLMRSIISCDPDSTPISTRRSPERRQVAITSSGRRSPWSARIVAAQVTGRPRRRISSATAATRGT